MPTRTTRRPAASAAPTTPLADLISGVAAGDRNAFAMLYDRTAVRVFGLCRRLIVDHAGAEDLTQEVFLEVWTKAARFDPDRGSAISWILQIAHHRAVDRIRTSESTRRRDIAHAEQLHRDHDTASADRRVVAAADLQILLDAIGALSQIRREAVLHAYFTDQSYQQASDVLGIPLGTFKSRVRDAVLALRPLLVDTD